MTPSPLCSPTNDVCYKTQNEAPTAFLTPQIGRLLYELVQTRYVDASTSVVTSVDWPYMTGGQINPPQVAVAAQDHREKNADNPLPEMELGVGDVIQRSYSHDYEARPGYWMGRNTRLRKDAFGEYPLNKVRPRHQTVLYRSFEFDDEILLPENRNRFNKHDSN